MSAHFMPTYLFPPLTASSELFSALLTPSHLISALFISSQLFSPHSQIICFLLCSKIRWISDLGAKATQKKVRFRRLLKTTFEEKWKASKREKKSKLIVATWRNRSNAIWKQTVATATLSNSDVAIPVHLQASNCIRTWKPERNSSAEQL